nr:7849_t:CDS:2 [Entrophospora candida]
MTYQTIKIEQITTDRIIESLNQSDLSDDLESLEYINDNYINDNKLNLTEKPLNDDEIVQMVLDKVNNENNESESEDIDEPKIIVTIANVLKAVDTLIEYFEHQNDLEFNENDYKNLKKYKRNIERSFSQNTKFKIFYNDN